MEEVDIIIIGAGAAGLMAGRILSKAGRKVVILEARDRTGGRIHTLKDNLFCEPVEMGAEFIHGDLPVTIGLLKEAGINYHTIEGQIWRYEGGLLKQQEDFVEDGDLLTARLKELKEDMTIADFLEQYFSDEKYASLRDSVRGFVEGYDAADTGRASAFALRDEWSSGDDQQQFRVKGGYIHLVNFLENDCRQAGCSIHLSAVVKEITWETGHVEVSTDKHSRYTSKKLLVTAPLGVLQSDPSSTAALSFSPALPEKMQAIQSLGFGSVIKILLEFDEAFWREKSASENGGKNMKNLGWLFSSADIPTWWTQLPDKSSLLTGWLAGPRAKKMKALDDETILDKSLLSLAGIFDLTVEELSNNLSAWRVVNWAADPFTRGAYAYTTLQTPAARKILSEPVNDTLFFAGEALYEGPEMGTVEGALASGESVAEKMVGG